MLKAAIISIVAVLAVTFSTAIQAQETVSGRNVLLPEESGYTVMPYRSHAEFALDLFLNRMQDRGLDAAIDPDDYIIGPGDLFRVYFVSGDISDISCRVGPRGRLFIKSVGSIKVAGLTLGEALEGINEAVARRYTGSEFEIQLTDFRLIRINIFGQVARPGIYYLPAVWRASEAIDLAGGVTSDASLRRIVLRGEDDEYPVDLVRFGAVGDIKVNPFICKGKSLYVPGRQAADKYVSVAGQVARPGIFEAVAGDRLADYLAYAEGIEGNPADMMVVVSLQDGTVSDRLDCADTAAFDFIPGPGVNLTLIWKEDRQDFGHVVIRGAVARPGRYPIAGDNFSLSDLLALSGGVASDGCFERISIFRRIRDYLREDAYQRSVAGGMSSSDLTSANKVKGSGGYNILSYNPRRPLDPSDLILIDGDSLFVPLATGVVSVSGAVVSPGLVRFSKGRDVEYYLKEAGGLGIDADRDRMVVINPVTGSGIGADKAGELYDGETLFVPRKEYGTKP